MLFSCYYKKVALLFEFFLLCAYIRVQTFKIQNYDNKNQHNFNKQFYKNPEVPLKQKSRLYLIDLQRGLHLLRFRSHNLSHQQND